MSLSTSWIDRFAGVERLYGSGSLLKLAQARVAVIGVGGVGSWAAEALARSGVGAIEMIDGDEVCISNTNRQLHALVDTHGRPKVAVMAERLRAINPEAEIVAHADFLTRANRLEQLDRRLDVVLDACDAFRVKVETIVHCRRHKLPLITVGSAGGRMDATQIRVRDLARTEQDALLSLIRKKLREEFAYPRNPKRYFGVRAVYSLENLSAPQLCASEESGRLDCGGGLGSATHITGAFGFVAVGEVLRRLLQRAP